MKQAKEIGHHVDLATEFVRDKIDSVFGNTTFTMICKVLVVLYAAFCVQKLPLEYSRLVENILVRFVILVLIAFITLNDPVLGLLLAVAFVLTIQASNRNKLQTMAQADMANEQVPQDIEPSTSDNDTFVDGNGDDDDDENPADKTLTDNLNSSSVVDSCQQNYFTNNSQLEDSQNNDVSGSNQMDQVQTWKNQMGPQGMNPPYGFDFSSADSPAQF